MFMCDSGRPLDLTKINLMIGMSARPFHWNAGVGSFGIMLVCTA